MASQPVSAAAPLAAARRLYDAGRYPAAWEAARSLGPLWTWPGAEGRVLAGRLAHALGAPRLGGWLHATAFRRYPTEAVTWQFAGVHVLSRFGPLSAWTWLERYPEPAGHPTGRREGCLLRARILGAVRDLDQALIHLDEAASAGPDDPWVEVVRTGVLLGNDRPGEALAATGRALALSPWYRPAVLARAQALLQLDRRPEARELLTEADRRLEAWQVTRLLAEVRELDGDRDGAEAALDRAGSLAPLLEAAEREAMIARRFTWAAERGDLDRMVALAGDDPMPWMTRQIDDLRARQGGARVLLPVPWVRQDHLTCAPATLTAIGRFFDRDLDAAEVAGAICHDGTPAWRERDWAASQDMVVHEFTVDWDTAVALIDRRVPFTLTTRNSHTRHLQAVIGYDVRQRALLVMDPSRVGRTTLDYEALAEAHRAPGLRGMVALPRALAERIEGVRLPDAAERTAVHQLDAALARHDRVGAGQALAALEALAPDDALTWEARGILAAYDGDRAAQAAAAESLLRLDPQGLTQRQVRSSVASDLDDWATQLSLAEAGRDRAAPGTNEALYWRRRRAEVLCADPAAWEEVAWEAEAIFRAQPADAGALRLAAWVRWEQGHRQTAVRLAGFASHLSDTDEELAGYYDGLARAVGLEEESLAWLEARTRRHPGAAGPVVTLARSLAARERFHDAGRVLSVALDRAPEDVDLLLARAHHCFDVGREAEAGELVDRLAGRIRPTAWDRLAARRHRLAGDQAAERAVWERVAAREVPAVDALAELGRLDRLQDEVGAAQARLDALVEAWPASVPVASAALREWERLGIPAYTARAAARLTEVSPHDPDRYLWQARSALGRGLLGEALEAAREAIARGPNLGEAHGVHGDVLAQLCRYDEAREAWRRALTETAHTGVLGAVLAFSDGDDERAEGLEWAWDALATRPWLEGELAGWARAARPLLGADAVEERLAALAEARPGSLTTRAAWIGALQAAGRGEAALAAAERLVGDFPESQGAWATLAGCRDGEAAVEAWRRAQALTPGVGWVAFGLARSLAAVNPGEVAAVWEALLARAPQNPDALAELAALDLEAGDVDAARARLFLATRVQPDHARAWELYPQTGGGTGETALWLDQLANLLEAHRWDDAVWESAARLAAEQGHPGWILDQWEAMGLPDPGPDLVDLLAACHLDLEQREEARRLCLAPNAEGTVAVNLRGRAAQARDEAGDREGAIGELTALLAEAPRYLWGWRLLASLSQAAGQAAQWLHAARRVVALSGRHQEGPALDLAEALLANGEAPAARRVLEEAWDAGSRAAMIRLVHLDLADGDAEAAEAHLAALATTEEDGETFLLSGLLALLREDAEGAVGHLEACVAAGWADAADALFGHIEAQAPSARPAALDALLSGLARCEWCLAARTWRRATGLPEEPMTRLRRLARSWGAPARARRHQPGRWWVLEEAIWYLGREGGQGAPFTGRAAARHREALWSHRRVLWSHPRTWGAGLQNLRDLGASDRQLAQWARRHVHFRDLPFWALVQTFDAVKDAGLYEEASLVADRLLAEHPAGEIPLVVLGYRALRHLWAGEHAAARRLRAAWSYAGTPFTEWLKGLIDALLALAEAPPEDREAAYRAVEEAVAAAAWSFRFLTHLQVESRRRAAALRRAGA